MRRKLMVVTSLMLGVVSVFIYLYFPSRLRSQAMSSLTDNAHTIAHMTAYSISTALFFDDREAAAETLAGAEQNPDLAYLVVDDGSGAVFGAVKRDVAILLGYKRPETIEGVSQDGSTFQLRHEVTSSTGRDVGMLYMGVSLDAVHAATRSARNRITVVSVILLLSGVVVAYATTTVLTAPLRNMATAAHEIARGDMSRRVAVMAKDEVGSLADAFNFMIDAVEERTESLKHEIVERERAEAERKKLEGQLRQSERLKTIGTLAGGIAHDFNNILAPILGYVDMALEDLPPDSVTHGDMLRVQSGAMRAKELVEQILSFSRQDEQERTAVLWQHVIAEALELIRHSLPATIEVRETLEADVPPVLADSTQLHQVTMNLCTNAFHAMAEGGGVLGLELGTVDVDADFVRNHPTLTAGDYVRLTVSDTGHGMNRQTLERIFEPFYTTKEVGQGTGLGLSVAHGIVEGCGGLITAYSEVGRGATFHVYLPALERRVAVNTADETSAARSVEGRILVVDDDGEIGRITKRVLERRGHEVTAFTSSVDARDTFCANPSSYDLVITDQTMPDLTGAQLAEALLAVRPDVPIIMTTGFSATVSKDDALASGIREFLMKPIPTDELAAAVLRVLEAEKQVSA
jgi:signal transduction histidine kinase/ActR/RegA family two-component response regulator